MKGEREMPIIREEPKLSFRESLHELIDSCEWDIFEMLSTAFYGKKYYFLQYDGTIYSRKCDKYLTRNEAILEFMMTLHNANEGG